MKFQGCSVKLNENIGMLIFILNEINIKISCFPYWDITKFVRFSVMYHLIKSCNILIMKKSAMLKNFIHFLIELLKG
jgi:hypothetical protein